MLVSIIVNHRVIDKIAFIGNSILLFLLNLLLWKLSSFFQMTRNLLS